MDDSDSRSGRGGIIEGKDSIGRVAVDGKAGAHYASDFKGCGRGNELITICPEAWAVTWGKSVND